MQQECKSHKAPRRRRARKGRGAAQPIRAPPAPRYCRHCQCSCCSTPVRSRSLLVPPRLAPASFDCQKTVANNNKTTPQVVFVDLAPVSVANSLVGFARFTFTVVYRAFAVKVSRWRKDPSPRNTPWPTVSSLKITSCPVKTTRCRCIRYPRWTFIPSILTSRLHSPP